MSPLLWNWHTNCMGGYEKKKKSILTMNIVESNHSQLLGKAMDAYSMRQKITAANIANADTPGYKRHEVLFEDVLQEAQQTNGMQGMLDSGPSIAQTDQDVVLEDELIEQSDTALRFQLVTRALRHHFSMVRGGITGKNQ